MSCKQQFFFFYKKKEETTSAQHKEEKKNKNKNEVVKTAANMFQFSEKVALPPNKKKTKKANMNSLDFKNQTNTGGKKNSKNKKK